MERLYGRDVLLMNKNNTPPLGGAYKGIKNQDAGMFRKEIASYNPKTAFFSKIMEACDFPKSAHMPYINILDCMSGPGKLGLDIRKKLQETMPEEASKFFFYFNNATPEPLMTLPPDSLTVCCDVRKLGQRCPLKFHTVMARYGIKDLPQIEQEKALKSIYESMAPGGRIVIADMTAYSPEGQTGIIDVHSAKQRLAGRNEAKEGRCYIPMIKEWSGLLADAGFQNVNVIFKGTSDTYTRQWAGQFGPGKNDQQIIVEINNIVRKTCEANPIFAKELDVTFSDDAVLLKWPIMVIKGDKPL